MSSKTQRKLFCLDGGGARGIIQAQMYIELCKQLKDDNLISKFDLVAGTSTGSILTSSLLFNEKGPSECIDLYKKLSKEIFHSNLGYYIFGAYSSFFGDGSWYDSQVLEKILEREFGTLTLQDVKAGKTSIDKKFKYPHWFCVATNITSNNQHPFLFRNYDCPSPNGKKDYKGNIITGTFLVNDGTELSDKALLSKSILSSCSAPTYFSPQKYLGNTFIDGGMFANCPVKKAMQESSLLFPEDDIGLVISFGTGTSSPDIGTTKITNVLHNWIDCSIVGEHQYKEAVVMNNYKEFSSKMFRFDPPNLGSERLDETRDDRFDYWISETKKYMNSDEIRNKIELLKKYL